MTSAAGRRDGGPHPRTQTLPLEGGAQDDEALWPLGRRQRDPGKWGRCPGARGHCRCPQPGFVPSEFMLCLCFAPSKAGTRTPFLE